MTPIRWDLKLLKNLCWEGWVAVFLCFRGKACLALQALWPEASHLLTGPPPRCTC